MNKRQRKKKIKRKFVHFVGGKKVPIKFLPIPEIVHSPDIVIIDYADFINPGKEIICHVSNSRINGKKL